MSLLKDVGVRQNRDIRYPGITTAAIVKLLRDAGENIPDGVIPMVRLPSGQQFSLRNGAEFVLPIEVLPDGKRVAYVTKARGRKPGQGNANKPTKEGKPNRSATPAVA